MMKKLTQTTAAFISLLVALFTLSGCGGATFVKGADPLKGTETVGVLIPTFKVMTPGAFEAKHVSDKCDADAAVMIADQLGDVLRTKGYNAKLITANQAPADMVKKYMALPRNFRHVISDPEAADLGNIRAFFKDNGIDRLIMVEGETVVGPSALSAFRGAAISTGIALATGVVGGGGAYKPMTFTYTSEVTPEGKFSFYNREQFTRSGDFLYVPDRKAMAEHAVDGWLAASK